MFIYFASTGQYVSYEIPIMLGDAFNSVFAILIFLTTLQFLNILNFNRHMWLVHETLKHASTNMRMFCLIFLYMYASFVMFGVPLFQTTTLDFVNHWAAFVYLGTVIIGRFKTEEINAKGFLFKMYFILFCLITVWTMTSLLISLLNMAISKAREELQNRENEADVIEYIMYQIKQAFRPNKIKKPKKESIGM